MWTVYEDQREQLGVAPDSLLKATFGGTVFLDPFTSVRWRVHELLVGSRSRPFGETVQWMLADGAWSCRWRGEGEFVPRTRLGPASDAAVWSWCEWLMRMPGHAGSPGWDPAVDMCGFLWAPGRAQRCDDDGCDGCPTPDDQRYFDARLNVLRSVGDGGLRFQVERRPGVAGRLWCVLVDGLARWMIASDQIRQDWFVPLWVDACSAAMVGDEDLSGPLFVADVVGEEDMR